MNKKRINSKIKHLHLEIQGNKSDGIHYFTDLSSGEQIGETIYICYLNQQSLEDWVKDAEFARKNPYQ